MRSTLGALLTVSDSSIRHRTRSEVVNLCQLAKRNLSTDGMSDKEGEGSESSKHGIYAKVLDERLIERIMCRMASHEREEDSSRQTNGGGEWAIRVRSEWGNAEPSQLILNMGGGPINSSSMVGEKEPRDHVRAGTG